MGKAKRAPSLRKPQAMQLLRELAGVMEHKVYLSMSLPPSHPLYERLHANIDMTLLVKLNEAKRFLGVPQDQMILPGSPINPSPVPEEAPQIKGIIHTPQGVHVVADEEESK